jgi:hypothetical protein
VPLAGERQGFGISFPDEVPLAVPVVPGVALGQPEVEHPIDIETRATAVTVRITLQIISTSTSTLGLSFRVY